VKVVQPESDDDYTQSDGEMEESAAFVFGFCFVGYIARAVWHYQQRSVNGVTNSNRHSRPDIQTHTSTCEPSQVTMSHEPPLLLFSTTIRRIESIFFFKKDKIHTEMNSFSAIF
jgi:hypothetical protein